MTELISIEVARLTAQRPLGDPQLTDTILAALIDTLRASGGRIYFLDTFSGFYRSVASADRSDVDAAFDSRRLRPTSNVSWGALESAVHARTPQVFDEQTSWDQNGELHVYASRVVFPILRAQTVVGLVDLHSAIPGNFRGATYDRDSRTEPAIQQLAHTYEAQRIRRILEKTAQFRVTIHEHEAIALANLVEFVAHSSEMPYVALRRLDADGSLTCIKTYGFGTSQQPTLDLNNIRENYVPFEYVIRTSDHWTARALDESIYDSLRKIPALKDVRSFVACPILLGHELWGVLSFATCGEYDYSDIEVFAFRALANLAGVALDAARVADSVAEVQFDDGMLMQAALSNEVVAATRHEMYDQLEVIGLARSAIGSIVSSALHNRNQRLVKSDIQVLIEQERSLDDAHLQMNKIFDTIRFSQSVLRTERKRVNVLEVWERAIDPFAFRINRAHVSRVSCSVSPVVNIAGSFDWLRIVFMHLILNSLDAFDRNFVKTRREISLVPGARSPRRFALRYFDNAGGVQLGELRRGGARLDGVKPSTIFERYVTSKPDGTGLGLASCRAALKQMNGSIELVDWRKGITFDIELDTWDDD